MRTTEYAERAGRVRDIGVQIALNRIDVHGRPHPRRGAGHGAWSTASAGSWRSTGRSPSARCSPSPPCSPGSTGPLTSLSNVRVDIMTALISFERVFEVLDLEPLVEERPGAVAVARRAVRCRARRRGLPLPISRRGVARLARGGRLAAIVAAGGEVLHDVTVAVPAGPARRPRRALRCRQDDARPRSCRASMTRRPGPCASVESTCAT